MANVVAAEQPQGGEFTFVSGGGKRPFEGFSQSVDLHHVGVRQSPFATFIDDRVDATPATS